MAGWIEASLSASGVEWMTIHNLIKKPTLTKYGIARMTVVQFGAVLRFREIVYLSSPEYIEWFLATGNTLFGINFDAMKTPKIWFEPMKRIEHILEPRFSDWLTPLQRFDDFAKSPANMQFREDQLQRMVAEVMIRKEDFADEPLKYTLVDVLAKDQLQPMPVLNTARIKENLEFLFFSGHHSITLALCHIVRQLSLQPVSINQLQYCSSPVLHHLVDVSDNWYLQSLYERVVEEADRTVMVPEHSESLIRNLVLEALRFHPPIEESPD
ncbi:RNA-directed RNA polymerase [Pseudozyma hubeiensis SY62]|uniref:RNA-directed RNA polymerase n=1 Tax=Pseudozyma hubeiensis (strain SY62) TaxID=1305764 RepID=R9P2P0_PSEHS|nr:RNA-directed RNA polymerase [Pseudozyma hubeiensis SY62]GAC95678.1 RNA-directed RNA polymerase [Pseudozyma hubeiensis SY62]